MRNYMFTITGQLKSGKNRVLITRTGHRYPPKAFKDWRESMLQQIGYVDTPFRGPVRMIVDYVPGDLKRRDMPGMLDALCHLMERAGIVEDDAQVKGLHWHQFPMDRKSPKCRVVLESLTIQED